MRIAIIGCGNMGMTYTRSFIHYKIVTKEDLILIEKNEERAEQLQDLDLGTVYPYYHEKLIATCDIIILAVKPQDFAAVAEELGPHLSERNLILSIMAGITLENMSSRLQHQNIVRAMPNTPALVGMGTTVYTARKNISIEQIRMVENLLNTTGRTFFFEDETLLDAVTALSGTGPAYFFFFVKQMIDAGKKMGMDEASAAMLVKQTMLGSFHLMNNADKTLDELILSVKSKGGTTEAALDCYLDNDVASKIQEGIFKAQMRAVDLSKAH